MAQQRSPVEGTNQPFGQDVDDTSGFFQSLSLMIEAGGVGFPSHSQFSDLLIYLLSFWGLHLVVVRDSSQLYTQELLLEAFMALYKMLKINSV